MIYLFPFSAIHQTFQQDLIRLRLQAGRATVQAHKMADQSVSDNAKHPVKLSAQVYTHKQMLYAISV